MTIKATSVDDYISKCPEDRQVVLKKLRKIIKKNLPKGFQETLGYGMPAYVVPLKTYPDGYHCKADTPLPFINIASQKNFVALYHMGIYANPDLMKLDMGKSCIRFKKMDDIPYDLIAELLTKISPKDWISTYEANIKK